MPTTSLKTAFRVGLVLSASVLILQTGLNRVLPEAEKRSAANVAFIGLAMLMTLSVLWYTAFQTRRLRPRLFPAWLLLAVSMTFNLAAAVLAGGYKILLGFIPTPSVIDFLILAIYPLLLMMVVLLPSRESKRLELIPWVFDALIIALSSGLVFWNFVIGPNIQAQHASQGQSLISAAYLIGDLVIFWALIMILFRRFREQQQGPLRWLFGAIVWLLIYDLSSTIFSGPAPRIAASPEAYSAFKETLLTASQLFLMMGALNQLIAIRQPIPEVKDRSHFGGWDTLRLMMPYAWLAAAYGVLFLSLVSTQALSPLAITVWLAVIIIGLVVIRQALVLRENQRLGNQLQLLNARLETRVSERTAELMRANELLAHNALHDGLTDLPNRALLNDHLEQSIRRIHRDPAYSFGLLYLDLDDFKEINDTQGHIAGDRLLMEIGRRLTATVREVDTVARLGGDEFVILLEGMPANEQLYKAAERVLESLSAPFDLDGQAAFMAASMGIVPSRIDYELPGDILRDADLAMYEAKSTGKNRFVLFTPELRTLALHRLILEKDLRLALDHGELYLQYQPIMNLQSGRLAGFEALLRWKHPSLGLISPATFIPMAESNGLIGPITAWILEQAIFQLYNWQKQFAFEPPLTISVNLSGRWFDQADPVLQLERLLAKAGLPSRCLVLEITESVLTQNVFEAVKVLKICQAKGVQVHMDDFGTGWSNYKYLKDYPVNTLKIGQEFVSHIQPDGENAEFVRNMVTLAQSLDLKVIAEGIETADQLAFICQLGCQGAQGFHISRPLTPEDATQFIARQQRA